MNTAEASFSTDDLRYDAIRRRDLGADDRFFYSVLTTGVYCRPSCGARLARRENVAFHATPDDAERAGYRPCKRCRPRDLPRREREARMVADACRTLTETSDEPSASLRTLAARAGLSPFHFHRVFKQHVGLTPREYAAAHRLRSVEEGIRGGASVTSAIVDAGYSSSSRFYEGGTHALGMTPSTLRRGGDGIHVRAHVRACALGFVLVATTPRGVCAVAFADDREAALEDLRRRFPRATIDDRDAGDLEPLVRAVLDVVERGGGADALPLDLIGTAFQLRVWRALREVPRGSTVTYSELARRIGAPRAVRAVGSACGKNPVAVVVPCHRVLRDDGALGGYRWGLERKRALLEGERTVRGR